ncbi:MAG: GNAT family N-acetyltransferase [Ilumatobacter sp.]|uniref:GNAT family N-acetyltransferase n=1 Tax=Ilumatobacter sp. TaxID=1967498 RepID=UPI0026216A19|nr:GNAT family N-acetyltransferase [Ilumatobacter sp.]MDJ0768292.1 GNAT family N-acetyltransferase [Ilumatobacter sp.]
MSDTPCNVVVVRLASESDIARLTRTATLAFAHDPVMRWFFPDDEYFELQPGLVEFMCRRWQATGSLWCTEDGVAMAGWVPPGRPEVDVEAPAVEHPPWRLERFGAIRAALEANTPPEPHWYLNMLATHPDWQRQGLGAALMDVVFEQADAAGLPCYLETESVENVAYYRRHGFEVRTEWDLRAGDDPGPHMWGMLRPAR